MTYLYFCAALRLLASLQMVDHHLEVIEDRDAKLQRLKALVQVYHLIQEKQIVPWMTLDSTKNLFNVMILLIVVCFFLAEEYMTIYVVGVLW